MKKMLNVLLLLLLAFTLATTAFAAERGQTVDITFTAKGNPGFAAVGADLDYPSDVLEYVSYTPILSGIKVNASKVSYFGSADVTGDIDLFTITFKIKDNAPFGTYNVGAVVDTDSTFNYAYDSVTFGITGGSVTVECKHANMTEWTEKTPADCENPQILERCCADCKGNYQTKEGNSATGHTAGEWVVIKEATCTEEGKKVQYCTVCQEVIKTATIEKKAHTSGEGSVITKEPTCTEKGTMEGQCAVCGEVLKTTEIEALGHDWDEGKETTAPTCEGEGVKTFTCGRCGATKTEKIVPIGHDWDEGKVTTEPTCTEKGVKTFTCKNDSTHTKTEEIAANGHTADENSVRVDPTCEEDGSITGKCAVCGAVLKEEIIPAIGHAWDEGTVTTAPTCTEKGVMTFTCQNDPSHTKTEEIPATGHAEPEWEKDETHHYGSCPTCGEDLSGEHDYRHEGDIVNGKREWLCACGAAIYKDLPSNHEDLDDVPKTGDITGQVVAFAACGLAAMMAVAYVYKRKTV